MSHASSNDNLQCYNMYLTPILNCTQREIFCMLFYRPRSPHHVKVQVLQVSGPNKIPLSAFSCYAKLSLNIISSTVHVTLHCSLLWNCSVLT